MLINSVGITEGGDAGLDFSWVPKLKEANIIISKNINDTLIQHVLDNQDKIILHITCTGFGGTVIEPNVPQAEWTKSQVQKLLEAGFPANQCVLRVDPIIPTEAGLVGLDAVLNLFSDVGIDRCRVSIIDQYTHVKKRFQDIGYPLPWDTFTCPASYIKEVVEILGRHKYDFESCAETLKLGSAVPLGCISTWDLGILGHTTRVKGKCPQRPTCNCLNIKTELLGVSKRCQHKCAYCYWR